MSTLSVDTIQGQTTAANVKMPAGHIIQMVQKVDTTTSTFNNSGSTYYYFCFAEAPFKNARAR